MEEEWKWIRGYEGLYQISNMGRLKSFKKNSNGYICSNVNKNGWYFTVNLFDEYERRRTVRIHVLVAETFIGEIPKGYHVHHKDGNRQNNIVSNLEIVHPSKHSMETRKLHPEFLNGMNNYNRYDRPKTIQQFTKDGHYLAEYVNSKVASDMTGVCQRNILQVAEREPYGKNGNVRKQAGGYVWKFKDESEVMQK